MRLNGHKLRQTSPKIDQHGWRFACPPLAQKHQQLSNMQDKALRRQAETDLFKRSHPMYVRHCLARAHEVNCSCCWRVGRNLTCLFCFFIVLSLTIRRTRFLDICWDMLRSEYLSAILRYTTRISTVSNPFAPELSSIFYTEAGLS